MSATKQEQMMRKVRALLAQAESPAATPEEAEAFSRKAEELIAAYAIDLALLEDKRAQGRGKPTTRTIDLDKNYKMPRATIIDRVARAFGCKLIMGQQSVTIVGFEADLDMVETLANSLLLQAGNGMLTESRRSSFGGTDLWRYRQDFLLGFANRAGERLRELYQEKADLTPGAGLVLRDRKTEVRDEFARLFPRVKSTTARVGHSGGYGSGQEAANRADLGGKRVGGGRKGIAS